MQPGAHSGGSQAQGALLGSLGHLARSPRLARAGVAWEKRQAGAPPRQSWDPKATPSQGGGPYVLPKTKVCHSLWLMK